MLNTRKKLEKYNDQLAIGGCPTIPINVNKIRLIFKFLKEAPQAVSSALKTCTKIFTNPEVRNTKQGQKNFHDNLFKIREYLQDECPTASPTLVPNLLNAMFGVPLIPYLEKLYPNISYISYDGKNLLYVTDKGVHVYGDLSNEQPKYLTDNFITLLIYRLIYHNPSKKSYKFNFIHPLYRGTYNHWHVVALNTTHTPKGRNAEFFLSKNVNQVHQPVSKSKFWTNNPLEPIQPKLENKWFMDIQSKTILGLMPFYNPNNLGDYLKNKIKFITYAKYHSASMKFHPSIQEKFSHEVFTDFFNLGIIHRLLKRNHHLNTFIINGKQLLYGTSSHGQDLRSCPISELSAEFITRALTHNYTAYYLKPSYEGIYHHAWHFKVTWIDNNQKFIVLRKI